MLDTASKITRQLNRCGHFMFSYGTLKTSLVAQTVKRLPTVQETRVQSLGQEDLLEKGMATHSSTRLENPMDGGAWWASVHGVAKSQI